MSRLERNERDVLARDLPELLAGAQAILADPRLRSIPLVSAGVAFSGRPPTLGDLLEAWTQGVFRRGCGECGAQACVFWAVGGMTGWRQVIAACPGCHRITERLTGAPVRVGEFIHPMVAIMRRRDAEHLNDGPKGLGLWAVAPLLRGEPVVVEGHESDGGVVFRYDPVRGEVRDPPGETPARVGTHGAWHRLPATLRVPGRSGTASPVHGYWAYLAHDGAGTLAAYADGEVRWPDDSLALRLDDEVPPEALTGWLEAALDRRGRGEGQ